MAEQVCKYEVDKVAEQINHISGLEADLVREHHKFFEHGDEQAGYELEDKVIEKMIDAAILEMKTRLNSLVHCILLSKK